MMDSEVNYSCFVGVQTAAFRIGGCQRVGDQQLRGESGAVIAVAGAGNKRPLPLSLYSSSAGGQSAQSPRTRRQVNTQNSLRLGRLDSIDINSVQQVSKKKTFPFVHFSTLDSI